MKTDPQGPAHPTVTGCYNTALDDQHPTQLYGTTNLFVKCLWHQCGCYDTGTVSLVRLLTS